MDRRKLARTGANQVNIVADNNNRVRYFHYNEFGTVPTETKAAGAGMGLMEGILESYHFGNDWTQAGKIFFAISKLSVMGGR